MSRKVPSAIGATPWNDKLTTWLGGQGPRRPACPQRRFKMASTARDIFVTGLPNAHAMETQARELMERQSERLTDYPEVQDRNASPDGEAPGQLKRLHQRRAP